METIAELFRRRTGGPIGIVSTAFIADATPGLCIPIDVVQVLMMYL